MEYSNPEIPEGINTTREHPLKEFFILVTGVLATVAIAVAILSVMAEKLVVYIPFSVEKELLADKDIYSNEKNTKIAEYLQDLSDKLTPFMDLPEDMSITVHYLDQDVENAYATLGGNIYIYHGLIKLLPNENALSTVLAHEIAHIKYRHPIIAMGRGVVIGLFLATVTGINGDHFVGQIVNDAGIITLLSFNRKQEQQADEEALRAINNYYGHINGSKDLFKSLLQLEKKFPVHPPEFLSTHPIGEKRITNIDQLARENHWNTTGKLTPIPADILESVKISDKN